MYRVKNFGRDPMIKNFGMGLFFVCFFAYSCDPSVLSCRTTAVRIDESDISPQSFGVLHGEPYMAVLRDYAQTLLAQQRFLEANLSLADAWEVIIKSRLLAEEQRGEVFAHIEYLQKKPEYGGDALLLQSLKQAVEAHEKHDMLIHLPDGGVLFAMTPEGIELLLKYRSLLIDGVLSAKQEAEIDKIYGRAMISGDAEVLHIAKYLKFRKEKCHATRFFEENQSQAILLNVYSARCAQDISDNYRLSEVLDQGLNEVPRLSLYFNETMRLADFQVAGRPTQLKNLVLIEYGKICPVVYAAVRKKIKETFQELKRQRKFLVYLKSREGEFLPECLQFKDDMDEAVCKAVKKESVKKIFPPEKDMPVEKKQEKVKCSKKRKKKEQDAFVGAYRLPLAKQVETDLPAEGVDEPGRVTLPASVECGVVDIQVQRTINQEEPEGAQAESPIKLPADCAEPTKKDSIVPCKVPVLADIHDYADGRVLCANEAGTVIIDDPSNAMRISLYQTDACDRLNYKPMYTQNITRWFESARDALSEQGYLDPASEKYAPTRNSQEHMVRIHRFSKLVDRYIATMGVKSTLPSRLAKHPDEIVVTIPGNMESYDSRQRRACLFVYYIDSVTGRCFHRNIQFKNACRACIDFCKKRTFDIEFPPLDSCKILTK